MSRQQTGAWGIVSTCMLALAPGSALLADDDPPGKVEPTDSIDELATLDIEDLLEVNVTSVAGVETKISETPAAIFVISNEDLRRGGFRSIADSLRMVPGLHVGQISSNTWAVASRGFNGRFASDLLVLVDGRAVYNDIFSGTLWDEVDLLQEDIERIEVIRGPGATLWGANAVNGVINIVSKDASETHGGYVVGGGGTEEQGFGGFRYGGQLDDDAHFRIWGKYFNRDGNDLLNGGDAPDDWDQFRGGLRFDLGRLADLKITLDASAYAGVSGQTLVAQQPTAPFTGVDRTDDDLSGGHFLARLAHETSTHEGWSFQAYYDRANRSLPILKSERDTLDAKFRHRFTLGDRHRLLWGLGYRHRRDRTDGSFTLVFDPDDRSTDKFSAFIQDTMTLIDDRLLLMVGSKFEHNDYSGFEVQPSARLTWTPTEHTTVWGSYSRAVRTPSRIEEDLRFVSGVVQPPLVASPTPIRILGDDGADAEVLNAFELGYRVRPIEGMTLDVAAFYNDIDDLLLTSPSATNPLLFGFGNTGSAEAYGFEVASTLQVAENWDIRATYAFTKNEVDGYDARFEQTSFPQQTASIRSHLEITDDLAFNAAGYFTDSIPAVGIGDTFRVDLGLTWTPRHNVEFSIWVQNLLDNQHPEFADPFLAGPPIEIERSIYAQLAIRF